MQPNNSAHQEIESERAGASPLSAPRSVEHSQATMPTLKKITAGPRKITHCYLFALLFGFLFIWTCWTGIWSFDNTYVHGREGGITSSVGILFPFDGLLTSEFPEADCTNQTLLEARVDACGEPFVEQACEDTNRFILLRNLEKNTSFSAPFDQGPRCDDGEGADGEGDYLLSQQEIIHVEASSSSFGGRIDPPVLHDGQIAGIQERPPPWSMNDTAICAQQECEREKAARRRDEWFSPFPFRRWLAILQARINNEGAYRTSVWSLLKIAVNSFGFIKKQELNGVFEYTINPLTFIRPPETRIDDSLLQEAIIACITTTTTTRIPHEALMEGDSGIHPTSDIGLVCIFLSFGVCIYIFGLMMLKPREFRISDKKLCSNEFRAQILVALMLFFVMVVPAAASVTAAIQTNKAAYSMAASNAAGGARKAVAHPGQQETTRGDEVHHSRPAPATTTSFISSSAVDEASSRFASEDWISAGMGKINTRPGDPRGTKPAGLVQRDPATTLTNEQEHPQGQAEGDSVRNDLDVADSKEQEEKLRQLRRASALGGRRDQQNHRPFAEHLHQQDVSMMKTPQHQRPLRTTDGNSSLRRLSEVSYVNVTSESELRDAIGSDVTINIMNDIVLSSPNDGDASAFEISATGLRINFNGFSIAFPTKDQGNGRIFYVQSGSEVTFSDLNVANGTVFRNDTSLGDPAVGAAWRRSDDSAFYFSC